jgi:hypothetical protein
VERAEEEWEEFVGEWLNSMLNPLSGATLSMQRSSKPGRTGIQNLRVRPYLMFTAEVNTVLIVFFSALSNPKDAAPL